MADAYPLQWPIGRPRWQGARQPSLFKMTEYQMKEHLFNELERMHASDIVVSTNRPAYSRAKSQPEDPGVAVYFKRKGQELCIACDKYRKLEDNMHAVGIAVQAFRGLERHGTGEMVDAAFSGFTALPESIIMGPGTARPWHEVLEVSPTASSETIKAAYKSMLLKHHPDQGGDVSKFHEVQKAFKEAMSGGAI